jgi:hypothetical protein
MAETSDFSFTNRDIADLTGKLSKFAKAELLNDKDWGLLLAIFAAAADHVQVGQDPTQGTFSGIAIKNLVTKVDTALEVRAPAVMDAGELLDQLRGAYIPGKPVTPIVDCVTPIKTGNGPPPKPDGPYNH